MHSSRSLRVPLFKYYQQNFAIFEADYSLIPPRESPRLRYFLAHIASTIIGTIATVLIEKSKPHSVPESGVLRPCADTGIVLAYFPVRIKAKKNSFQLNIVVTTIIASSPPRQLGIMMEKRVLNLLQPSILAASSRANGISSKKLLRTNMTMGRLKVR